MTAVMSYFGAKVLGLSDVQMSIVLRPWINPKRHSINYGTEIHSLSSIQNLSIIIHHRPLRELQLAACEVLDKDS